MDLRKGLLAGLAFCGLLCVSAAANAANVDIVVKLNKINPDGSHDTKEFAGRIVKDDYKGVTINANGPEFTIVRNEIEVVEGVPQVMYGQSGKQLPDEYAAAVKKYNEGDFDGCVRKLGVVIRQLSKLPENQQPLMLQHLYYYRGAAVMAQAEVERDEKKRKEGYDEARGHFEKLLQKKEDTAWYFEAKFSIVRCLEAMGGKVGEKYDRLVTDFNKKVESAPWGAKYVFLAELGSLRETVKALVAAKDTAKLTPALAKVMEMAKSKALAKYGTPGDKAELIRVKADILGSLGRYEELIGELNGVIRMAQRQNDRGALQTLYLKRADANYELSKTKQDKKAEYLESARTDYLRLVLSYDLVPQLLASAHCRIGEAFMELKDGEEWKTRASSHLRTAKGLNQKPGSDEAKNLLDTLK